MTDDESESLEQDPEAETTAEKVDTEASNAVYELYIGLTGVYSLVVAVMIIALGLFAPNSELLPSLNGINVLLCILFLIDFFRSLWRAKKRRVRYLVTWGWVDFLGSLPFPALRVFRVARIWRAIGNLRDADIVADLQEKGADAMLMVMVFTVIVLLTFSGIAVYYFERNAPGANITKPDNAFWWSIVTITTVGYGDYYPITEGGRSVAILLMAAGLGIIGVLSSYLSQLLVRGARGIQMHRLERLAAKDPHARADLEKAQLTDRSQLPGPAPAPAAAPDQAPGVMQLESEIVSLRALIEERLPASEAADE